MRGRLSTNHINLIRGDVRNYELVLEFCREFYKNRIQLDTNASDNNVRLDGSATFIEEMLENPYIHDPDYEILKYLNNHNSILLDIGASWGYSAGAFIKLGIKSKIVSFEVIEHYDDALGEIAKRFPDKYSYFLSGLGDSASDTTFVAPVLNNMVNSGLCSASNSPHLEGLTQNIIEYIDSNNILDDHLKLNFFEFSAVLGSLDEFIPNKLPKEWQGVPVEAIKLDVEGLEYSVLNGGRCLLEKYHPLVLAEGGNRTSGIQDLMIGLGYIYAERVEDKLYQYHGFGRSVNGFFLHSERLTEYRKLGIFRN